MREVVRVTELVSVLRDVRGDLELRRRITEDTIDHRIATGQIDLLDALVEKLEKS
jgi:hypothetical protein